MKSLVFNKFYLSLLGIILIMMIGLMCADVPSNAPPFPEFKSKVRFIHAATDLGDVTVVLDGDSQGALSMGNKTSYIDLDAGYKFVQLQGGAATDTANIQMDTDNQLAVYIVTRADDSQPRFVKKTEKLLFAESAEEDTLAHVLLAQMIDASLAISVRSVVGGDTTTHEVSSGLGFTGSTWVELPAAGTHLFSVKLDDNIIRNFERTYQPAKSYTEVIYNTVDNPSIAGLKNE